MKNFERKAYDTASVLSRAIEAVKEKSVATGTAQATTEQKPKEVDITSYLTDAERARMEEIENSPMLMIKNKDKEYFEPSRRSIAVLNHDVITKVNAFFAGAFADYVGCEMSVVQTADAKQIIQTSLVFTPKPEKIEDDDTRFHNLIEIGNTGKNFKPNSIANQISQVSAHASGRYFKLNNATKKILERYIPDTYFEFENGVRKIDWTKYDKGTAKMPLTVERVQPILHGKVDNNGMMSTVTMEYVVVVDINKIVNDIIKLNDSEDEYKKTVLFCSVAGVIPTIQSANGQSFAIRIEEVDVHKDEEESALFGLRYVTSNNYFFGSNIR